VNPTTLESPAEVKARGAFYTPPAITSFIARWAIRDPSTRTLEPACGDGAFLAAAAARYVELGRTDLAGRLIGVERSADEAAKASAVAPSADVRIASFFDVEPEQVAAPFGAVIGNPPYIRYHGFNGEDRVKGLARASAVGVHLTRLASSWAHFVAHATSFLAPEGRLGLVLPAELLVTDYAQPVRAYLARRFSSVVIVAFDRMVFEDAQVDAVLLLASNDTNDGVRVIRTSDAETLRGIELGGGDGARTQRAGRWSTSLDAGAEAIYDDLIRSGIAQRLSAVATVDIGVVTGANSYFVLSPEEAEARKLPANLLIPIVRRPTDVRGLTVREDEHRRLLVLPPGPPPEGVSLARYLRHGRKSEVDRGYKARVRKFWYSVPLPKKRPRAFLPYMTGDVPRLIVNESGAWSTNLLHGVVFIEAAPDPRVVSAAMLSSVTALSAEVEGRAYGGGVLKLETRESERLLVPVVKPEIAPILERLHPELDALVREGQQPRASRLVDAVLGIDFTQYEKARSVFRTRRLERRSTKRESEGG
jgi:adenine-specific DNA-methyltransferase